MKAAAVAALAGLVLACGATRPTVAKPCITPCGVNIQPRRSPLYYVVPAPR
jgi:hypothetical protein